MPREYELKGSPFDSGVVQELGRLNETRPGCDVVAIALNADREAALAATPFRGPGFHLQEWPNAFVVRRINLKTRARQITSQFRLTWHAVGTIARVKVKR